MSAESMPKAFNPEQTACMTRALLRAAAKLESAELFSAGGDGPAKVVLARAIVAAAEQGECDEDRLVVSALDHFVRWRNEAAPQDGAFTPA